MNQAPSKEQLEIEEDVRLMEEQVLLDEISNAHSWSLVGSKIKFWTFFGAPMATGAYFVNLGLRQIIRQTQYVELLL